MKIDRLGSARSLAPNYNRTPYTKRFDPGTILRFMAAVAILQFSAPAQSAADAAPQASGIASSTARPMRVRPPVVMTTSEKNGEQGNNDDSGSRIHPVGSKPYGLSYSE